MLHAGAFLFMEIAALYKLFLSHPFVSTDSRSIPAGGLFFALKGDRFDGNLFAGAALESGAAYCIIDDPAYVISDRCILVDDVLLTLQELAQTHRASFKFPVLAITGSNGKTTTKELCREVLSKKYRTHATKGNLNNHIGVPLTLLSAPRDTEFMIVEMGANHQGEIDSLCNIALPDFVMITNIGRAHLEGFGGPEGVKKGKSEMYRYAASSGGCIFLNTNDEVLVSVVPPGADIIPYRADTIQMHETPGKTLVFQYMNQMVDTRLYGSYNIPNIAFAIAAGEYFGIPSEDVVHAISGYTPDNNRSQVIQKGSITYIKDAYNANPSSMRASLEQFMSVRAPKRIIVLGDMLELGAYSKDAHLEIIDMASKGGFSEMIFIGPCFYEAGENLSGNYFTDTDAARAYFNEIDKENATVLLKGSRGIAVEKLLD